jgi:cytochrome c oxidase subunit 2
MVAGFPPLMPTFQGVVSEEQIAQLTAYVKSLATTPAPSGGGAPAASPTPQAAAH